MLFPYDDRLVRTIKFDAECAIFADGHYSRQSPGSSQFAPPGETLILRNWECSILFVWCHQLQKRADNQEGVNCTIFRNESKRLSSEIILEAEIFAMNRWGSIRVFTYIDARKIKSSNPGYCFKKAGWARCGMSGNGKLLLEKYLVPEQAQDAEKERTL